jgi:DNA-binding transcriptional LysR family regulator
LKHHLPPLDSLKTFEAAARHLSFSAAAAELCLTKSAISYQIRKLEAHLQCALFKRTVRQVYLTDAGQMLLQSTQQIFAELDDTLRRISGDQRHTGVTIAATTYVAARWLSPRISEFNARYPDIPVLLQHTVSEHETDADDVDLAIRWGPCDSRARRDCLGEIPMQLYPAISPSLLRRHGLPMTDLTAKHLLTPPLGDIPLLCEDRPQDLWQEWLDAAEPVATVNLPNPRRLISDANVRVQAAIDGQGLILADDLMRNEFANGLLVAPFVASLKGYGYSCLASDKQIGNANSCALKDWVHSWLPEASVG